MDLAVKRFHYKVISTLLLVLICVSNNISARTCRIENIDQLILIIREKPRANLKVVSLIDLCGRTIILPCDVRVDLSKGKIVNGTIEFNHNQIKCSKGSLGEDITLKGIISNSIFNLSWIEIREGITSTKQIQTAVNLCQGNNTTLFIPNGEYLITPSFDNYIMDREAFCIKISKSISIRGESRDNTILRTIAFDYSSPSLNPLNLHGQYQYATLFKCHFESDSFIRLSSITFDGNSNIDFYKHSDKNLAHKCLFCDGQGALLQTFDAIDVCVKNFESEAFYNEAYDESCKYLVDHCVFYNNGGSSGNLGGNCTYTNCIFEKANIEHCFNHKKGGSRERCIINKCRFFNRCEVMCDIGQNQASNSPSDVEGISIYINECLFENSITFLSNLPKNIQATAISTYEAENIYIRNNSFINASVNQGYGSSCINFRKNAINVYLENNTFDLNYPGAVLRFSINTNSNIMEFIDLNNTVTLDNSIKNDCHIESTMGPFKLNYNLKLKE